MWKFIISSSNKDNWYENSGNEVCFIGRSNVGKSSLLNALANQKIAKVSSVPGKTQLINFFENNNKNIVVDLPGYGYAKMAKHNNFKMLKMIQDYLKNRKQLKTVFLLFDTRIGLQTIDFETLKFLNILNHKVILVGTKIDKLNQSQFSKIKKTLEQQEISNFVLVSSKTKKNIDILNEIINNEFSEK
ncbi:ribosome biogenesis GTP-binding protein YihA/YsxC [Mesomycoplasma neurolyticum]|uniref:Probable GTP-binding protein EngB n=1 Tax=Mesomycoplasma neurolyticum TaxID=2120 RepID=A0A449A4G5_9BACT|nr:ribosome biogenesis GTP-binding protein YihA/YsxC [Mesomycoplasma neurolyticum]VEU59129.1 GTPase EngB [Mesomycoplasma neurolyticum]